MDKFDEMVEALEENEDLVECQECFDLFPKIDCIKQSRGYLCPACGKLSQTRKIFDTVEPSVFDTYDQEFPDVQNYNPNSTRDYESEPTLGDVLNDLIRDEYEAIDGYEVADETIQHAKLDPEVKDDILDTLDHIKEEEEEHIEELTELVEPTGEERVTEKKDADEPVQESVEANGAHKNIVFFANEIDAHFNKKYKIEILDGYKVHLIDETKDMTTEINSVKNIAANNLEADTEKLSDGTYVYMLKKKATATAESLTEDAAADSDDDDDEEDSKFEDEETEKLYEVAEAQTWVGYTLNGGEFVGACKALSEEEAYAILEQEYSANWVSHGYEADELVIELASEEDLADLDTTDYLTEAEVGKIKSGVDKAANWVTGVKRKITKAKVNLEEIFTSGFYLDLGVKGKYKDAKGNDLHGSQVATLKEGEIAAKNAAKLAKTQVTLCANTEGVKIEDPNIAKLLEKHKTGDGEGWKLVTYSATGSVNRSYIEEVNKALQKIELANRNLDGVADGEKKVFLADILKDKKAELGPMKDKEGYTKESYAEYVKAYGNVIKELEAIKDKTALAEYDVESKREEIEGLLVTSSGLDDSDDLETLRAEALKIIGDKKEAKGYTPQSYATYSTNFDKASNLVNKASGEPQLKALIRDLPAYMEKLNAILQAVDSDITDDEDDISEEESVENLKKLKDDLADKILDQAASAEDNEKYTEESCNAYDTAITALAEELDPIATIEAFRDFESKVNSRIEELRKNLTPKPEDAEEDSDTTEEEKVSGKLKYTNKGKPREALGDVDSPEYKNWGFPEKVAYDSAVQKEWKNLVGILKELVIGSGAKHTGDLQKLADTLGRFLNANSSKFIFEAFKRKLIRECSDSEEQSKVLTEQLSKLYREHLVEDFDEDTVECTWCHDTFDRSECRYEVDLEWLCSRCEAAIKSRGETLTFRENNYWDFLDEDLKDTDAALSELKDTQAALKSTAAGIKNMTQAMREEYHRYANPAELKAMEDLEAVIETAKDKVLNTAKGWDIDIRESDAQGWMSGNKEYTYQFMLDYEGIDEDEEEDVQDQLQNMVENAVLSQYNLPPELSKISVSVMLPDPDIAYDDWDDEGLQDVKRASLLVDVTFARNLI